MRKKTREDISTGLKNKLENGVEFVSVFSRFIEAIRPASAMRNFGSGLSRSHPTPSSWGETFSREFRGWLFGGPSVQPYKQPAGIPILAAFRFPRWRRWMARPKPCGCQRSSRPAYGRVPGVSCQPEPGMSISSPLDTGRSNSRGSPSLRACKLYHFRSRSGKVSRGPLNYGASYGPSP